MPEALFDDAANDDEDAPPSDFHMEEGEDGFIAVAMAALDCCQNVVVLAAAVADDDVAATGGCC